MKSSRILAPMSRKRWITLLLILLTTSNPQGQEGISSAGLLCVSECETCPEVCSPPPCPPKSPPPPAAAATHHSPPSHPAPPPPPELYVYNPGTGPGMVQQNFSYPYYYFYSSKAVTCSLPLHHSFFLFVLFMFFQFC